MSYRGLKRWKSDTHANTHTHTYIRTPAKNHIFRRFRLFWVLWQDYLEKKIFHENIAFLVRKQNYVILVFLFSLNVADQHCDENEKESEEEGRRLVRKETDKGFILIHASPSRRALTQPPATDDGATPYSKQHTREFVGETTHPPRSRASTSITDHTSVVLSEPFCCHILRFLATSWTQHRRPLVGQEYIPHEG